MKRKLRVHFLTIVALALSATIVAQAQSPTLLTRHTREEVTSRIAPLVGHLSATKNLDIVLVLQHRNQSELEQFLKDVQDRSNPSYHQ